MGVVRRRLSYGGHDALSLRIFQVWEVSKSQESICKELGDFSVNQYLGYA